MKSDQVFGQYISDSFIKDKISLLQKKYDQMTAVHADKTGMSSFEVCAFVSHNCLTRPTRRLPVFRH